MLAGDTTRAGYESLCQWMAQNRRQCDGCLGDDGKPDTKALAERVARVGASLRPPCHWDITAYTARPLSLSVYLERSGSMTPYDTRQGGGELKRTVNDLINFFPGAVQSRCRIFIVNDDVYPYQGTVSDFLKDKDIYASTAGRGNAAYTDFGLIINKILSRQSATDVSVLITDLIYSPRDAQGVSTGKIFNEENALATGLFGRYPDKQVMVSKFSGSYHGPYYCYDQSSAPYHGRRPYYVLVMADGATLSRMAADASFATFLAPAGAEHTCRFGQSCQSVTPALLPQWPGRRGRYHQARGADGLQLEDCEPDPASGILQLSVAVNFSALALPEATVCDAAQYEVRSAGAYRLTIGRVTPEMVRGNAKAALAAATHVLTLSGKPADGPDEIVVRLRDTMPAWVAEANSYDDTSRGSSFATTTFGLEPLLSGIRAAYCHGDDARAEVRIKLDTR